MDDIIKANEELKGGEPMVLSNEEVMKEYEKEYKETGLRPRYLVEMSRIKDLIECFNRYKDDIEGIHEEWVEEFQELMEQFF